MKQCMFICESGLPCGQPTPCARHKMSEAELREEYAIPNHFTFYKPMNDSQLGVFSFCDEDITVHADGSATWSGMGLNARATDHEFYNREWAPRRMK